MEGLEHESHSLKIPFEGDLMANGWNCRYVRALLFDYGEGYSRFCNIGN